MKSDCPHCEKPIRGLVFPDQKWLGMKLYPRNDKGRYPHCDRSIAFNPRFLSLWIPGWLSFTGACLMPVLASDMDEGSATLRTFLFLVFVLFIPVSLFGTTMYKKVDTPAEHS